MLRSVASTEPGTSDNEDAAAASGKAGAGPPELARFPASQISGHNWIIDVLDDLIRFSRFHQLRDTELALRRSRAVATAELGISRPRTADD